jgi:hypothetical protein
MVAISELFKYADYSIAVWNNLWPGQVTQIGMVFRLEYFTGKL